MNFYTIFDTPLGEMTAASAGEKICLFDFSGRKNITRKIAFLEKKFGGSFTEGKNPVLDSAVNQAVEYFSGKRKQFTVSLLFTGTPFQKSVWNGLLKIPYGITVSYKELAVRIGGAEKVRAVANANGANFIAVIVPCHRVIGSNGTLTGYGGGLWRKKWLIEHEKKHL